MASDTEDPETAADRLEAALERIAQAATREALDIPEHPEPVHAEEIAARLDVLIEHLRTVLGGKAD
jgi:hypothetical protein